ncbi:hypothetical protein LOK49_LG02G00691 [Camellia lanceoleosa]|uniref:Uncharacterized protein n=1 Tax=Camellia lanceoleosa TaxID=1840588 RepID=A0ACC0IKS1_9ERIC|nr:hypothetical protein LOK49_LG02G00691 [Camellia lanceoleosa]
MIVTSWFTQKATLKLFLVTFQSTSKSWTIEAPLLPNRTTSVAIISPLSILFDKSKSIHRDSWHRFSNKKKSHGWCDFTPSTSILDPKSSFLLNSDSILTTADILVLNESINFSHDNIEIQSNSMTLSVVSGLVGDGLRKRKEGLTAVAMIGVDGGCQ